MTRDEQEFHAICREVWKPLVGLPAGRALIIMGSLVDGIFHMIEDPYERALMMDDWISNLRDRCCEDAED